MDNVNIKHLRTLALFGVLGGVLMLIGDYLFFLTPWVSGAEFQSVSAMHAMSNERLIWGAVAGPFSGMFYALGSCLFYVALKPHNKILAALISIGFVVLWILAGAFHSIYAVVGFVGEQDVGQVVPFVQALIATMGKIATVLGLAASVLFVYMVLRHKTVFPKWIILFLPTFLTLLRGPLTPLVPAPLGSIIIGGWPNWCFVGFFLLLAFLWRRGTV